jgi:hypothetical protein
VRSAIVIGANFRASTANLIGFRPVNNAHRPKATLDRV